MEAHTNQTVNNNYPNEDDFDPDDKVFAFCEDDNDGYKNVDVTLNELDLLHGYTPDDGNASQKMEEDGVYPDEFMLSYEEMPSNGIQEDYYHCNGHGLALCHNTMCATSLCHCWRRVTFQAVSHTS